MTVKRRAVFAVLLTASLAIPTTAMATVCCASPPDDQLVVVASSCRCPAACALQADPCDSDASRFAVDVAPLRDTAQGSLLTEAASPSSTTPRILLSRAADLPAECATPPRRSCHAVSLPLRL